MSTLNERPYRGLLPRGYRRLIARGMGVLLVLLCVLAIRSAWQQADLDFDTAVEDMDFDDLMLEDEF